MDDVRTAAAVGSKADRDAALDQVLLWPQMIFGRKKCSEFLSREKATDFITVSNDLGLRRLLQESVKFRPRHL